MPSLRNLLRAILDQWPIVGIALGILITLGWALLLIWLPLHHFHVL
jgi:hypothetical protein